MNVKIYPFSISLCVLNQTTVQRKYGVAFLHSWLYTLGVFTSAHWCRPCKQPMTYAANMLSSVACWSIKVSIAQFLIERQSWILQNCLMCTHLQSSGSRTTLNSIGAVWYSVALCMLKRIPSLV